MRPSRTTLPPPRLLPLHVRLRGKYLRLKKKVKLGARLVARLPTNHRRALPDFLILGAPKCGTSSLYVYLAHHPQVLPALRKEVYFFDRTFARGLAWYRSFFPTHEERARREAESGSHPLTGEATPSYLIHPLAPRRVYETVPEARLVVILRHPVDRAYSLYQQARWRRLEPLGFEEAIEAEPGRIERDRSEIERDPGFFSLALQAHSYLSGGRYLEQIERWLEFFPREQLHCLVTEELRDRPSQCYRGLLEFLGLSPWEPPEYKKLHRRSYHQMDPETRRRLIEDFRPHNERLYEFLGRDLGWERG